MSTKTLEFAKCNADLRALTPILKNWCFLHDFYARHQMDDAAYWYNERASISILAAAAWQQKNWVALEEYSTRKVNPTYDGEAAHERADRSGRCDLFIGSNLGNAQFAIEAKHCWQPIGSRVKDDKLYLHKAVKDAWNDAGDLQLNEATNRLAVVFCTPSINIKTLSAHVRNDESIHNLISSWAKNLEAMLFDNKIDGLAYCFPKKNRHLEDASGKRIFPGAAVVIRQRLRSK